MKSSDIRSAFLEYFKSKGHTEVRSASLIPRNDPSLLFTNAGMVQFKSVFLGEEQRSYTRAVTSQKCIRAGGKHNDLENVGHTARHHTFFEMLGNFSFGDYFKKDAILYAWELLTEIYKLPKDRLWVSVYEEDDEAEKLWRELTDIPEAHIVRLGAKDNFWQMGDTGPCGPCSEILIDQGEDMGCGKSDCKVGCDCDRYLEIWNLVFMQYNRDTDGSLHTLPSPSIDTGMGLERLSAVLQGKKNNFDSDLFSPIINAASQMAGVAYGKSAETDISLRVIADHIRSTAFLLSEGLIPSNEGRGYVLRRIIRRAARHARLLGMSGNVLSKLLGAVGEVLGPVYPELLSEQERAVKVLSFEEERFTRTLEQGMRLIDDIISHMRRDGSNIIPGAEIFKLYDTYGLPLDLARDIALDNHMQLDEDGFNREMQEQRERARASWVGEEESIATIYRELQSEIGETEFLGYETLTSHSVIKSILKDGKVVLEAEESEEVELLLDKTPFYGESGGQTGDTGAITGPGFEAEVLNTKKELGLHSHIVRITDGKVKVWDRVNCYVDSEKRFSTARNHTATHLVHTALRNVLGDHVKQAGSLVSPDRMRFDFTHFYPVDSAEITAIEDMVNTEIIKNIPVRTEIMDLQQAVKAGVIALFGEKYGEKVRVVRVEGYSAELCGGTHARATGDIGSFVIVSEGSVASGIRRLEALTGLAAYGYLSQKRAELRKVAEALKTDKPYERVIKLMSDMRDVEKQAEALKSRLASKDSTSIIDSAKDINGIKVLAYRQDNLELKDLRVLADNVRDRLGSGVILIASVKDEQASMLLMVTKDMTQKLKAGDIMKQVTELCGGRGGGKPDMAQGGTKELNKLDAALSAVYEIVRKSLQQ